MSVRTRLGLVGILVATFGCGAAPNRAPETAQSAASESPKNDGNEAQSQPPVVVDSAEAHATNTNVSTPAQRVHAEELSGEETFPSGLVVDVKELGGRGPLPELPKDSRILHVGDSFAGALGVELNKVFKDAGVKSRLDFETSTYIPTWASLKNLKGLVSNFNPDLVIISLGANELENPEPEKRAPLIKKIVASAGGRSCVWVAPVLWDGAKTALLDVIKANVEPCVYLDMNRLVKKMPRAGDKIHPSMAARPDWALVTARWLAYHRKPTSGRPWELGTNP
jgi:hypothetical protein